MSLLHLSRFSRLRRLGLVAALATTTFAALAQDSSPIRMLVGFPAGGSTDVVARDLALRMQQELGRSVVVDNRPGAGGQIAAQALKAAKPDGSTIYLSNSHTVAMIPLTMKNPGFDTAKDFTSVALVGISPDVLAVNPTVVSVASPTLKDFAQWAKANPGKGNVGVPAPASAPDFAVGVVAKALGTDLKSVPYRGDGPVAQDLVAGQVAAGIGSIGVMLQHAQAGRIKIVAVNGTRRLAVMPDVPTYAEQGVAGYENVIFAGMFAPAGTPPALIQRYNAAIQKIVRSPEFSEKLAGIGMVASTGTPADLDAMVKDAHDAWTIMVKNANYQPQ